MSGAAASAVAAIPALLPALTLPPFEALPLRLVTEGLISSSAYSSRSDPSEKAAHLLLELVRRDEVVGVGAGEMEASDCKDEVDSLEEEERDMVS